MTDQREIEGTAARAADRGRAEDLGFSMDSRPSLGNADVVRGLMSEFATAIVANRKAYNEGKTDGEAAQARVRELSKEYADIIMGRDKRYDALPWNDPARLGKRIMLVIPEVDGVEDPGEALFLTVGTSLNTIAVAHEEDRMSDHDAEHNTKAMLEDAANLILGTR